MPGVAAAVVGSAGTSSLGAAKWAMLGLSIKLSAAIIGGIASFVTSYVISAAFGLNKAPKQSDRGGGGALQRNQDRTISVRQPIAAHRVIYGQVRVGGIISFLHTTDETNICTN